MRINVEFTDGIKMELQADKITENDEEIILHESEQRFYTALIKSKIKKYIIGGVYEKTLND